MTWEEVCADSCLQDLPYKIELNQWGNIEMSPASRYHAEFQGLIIQLLLTLKPEGVAIPECPIDTAENTKAADVAWISHARRKAIPYAVSYTSAPEICVEIVSPSNTLKEQMHKGTLYLRAGATEFWLCDERGNVRFFDADGEKDTSLLCPRFPTRIEVYD